MKEEGIIKLKSNDIAIIDGIEYYYIINKLTKELTSEKTVRGSEKKRIGIKNEIVIFKQFPKSKEVFNLYKIVENKQVNISGEKYCFCEINVNPYYVELDLISDKYLEIEKLTYL